MTIGSTTWYSRTRCRAGQRSAPRVSVWFRDLVHAPDVGPARHPSWTRARQSSGGHAVEARVSRPSRGSSDAAADARGSRRLDPVLRGIQVEPLDVNRILTGSFHVTLTTRNTLRNASRMRWRRGVSGRHFQALGQRVAEWPEPMATLLLTGRKARRGVEARVRPGSGTWAAIRSAGPWADPPTTLCG